MEVMTIGGYNEVGKNMTALKVDDEIIVLDMGFFLPKLIDYEEGGDRKYLTTEGLIKLGAIPNDKELRKEKNKVKAIIVSHCHLDHSGGVPYLANNYNVPIYGSPYTIEVLKYMLKDEGLKVRNNLKAISPNGKVKISKNITIEFINMTHSTLQVSLIAVHTRRGTLLYANDFKFDNHPVIGKKPNYDRLKELGKDNVIGLVVDSLYSSREGKTPSEKVAREMLKDVMLGTENQGNAIFATCFASHLARMKSMLDFGKKLNRNVVFVGRSMHKYITAAENINLINFSKQAEIISFKNKVEKLLKKVEKNRGKYLIVCTGGQGEPGSILTRIAINQLPFKFLNEDHIIFSNKTIPVEINIENRRKLEERLKQKKARLFTSVHVSGHASREDLRDLIKMVNPQNIIPAHGDHDKIKYMVELAEEMGYKEGKNVFLLNDNDKVEI